MCLFKLKIIIKKYIDAETDEESELGPPCIQYWKLARSIFCVMREKLRKIF